MKKVIELQNIKRDFQVGEETVLSLIHIYAIVLSVNSLEQLLAKVNELCKSV